MNIIKDNKIDLVTFKESVARPAIFAKSTDKFWDDEHISEQMLNFHLNPDVEAASKTRDTISAEADFIIRSTGMSAGKSVIDLGCGPGLYVREFAATGAKVTGIDISQRSLNYACENIKKSSENVDFIKMNYLEMNFRDSFDIATLIFYDFCALSTDEQNKVLINIHNALKDNGIFVFDIVTEKRKSSESTGITVHESGFWSSRPYIEILNTCVYDEPKTEGLQYTIIAEDGKTRIIRLYHRLFGVKEIIKLLNDNNFEILNIYKNLKGEDFDDSSETMGIVARKS